MFGNKKRLKKMIQHSFGKNPLEGFWFHDAGQRLDNVRRLHNAMEEKETAKWQVDDITWHDLEMDQVFLRINHTNSFIGEQSLYRKMHLLDKGDVPQGTEQLEKRLDYLQENPELREDMELQIRYVGKHDEGYYLPEFLLNSSWWKIGSTLIYHVLQVLLVICLLGSVLFQNVFAITGLVFVALINLAIYLFSKQKYEVYFNALSDFKRIYDCAKWVEGKDRQHKIFITDEVRGALHRLKSMSKVIVGMNGRRQASMMGDAAAVLTEYIWGMLLVDISMFNHIMGIIHNKQEDVLVLLDFVGELDADIAILSYRNSVEQWCLPVFAENGLVVEGVAHPLIENPVKNDFTLKDRAIITGANASGKSTFMKSIAINCILAQTIHTCIAEKMVLQPMQITTCMALRDDIITGESYYFREAKYLKRMLDFIATESSVLIVIDEILKGTNTKERVAASKAILDYIGNTGCMALVATHDNELTESSLYKDYHFSSKMLENDIVFDYLIHEGTSKESNAIALLSYLGYPRIIVEKARFNMHENR